MKILTEDGFWKQPAPSETLRLLHLPPNKTIHEVWNLLLQIALASPLPEWQNDRKLSAIALIRIQLCDRCRGIVTEQLKEFPDEQGSGLTPEDYEFADKLEAMREKGSDEFLDRLGWANALSKTCKRMMGENLPPKIEQATTSLLRELYEAEQNGQTL
jgi:hypothetical protein